MLIDFATVLLVGWVNWSDHDVGTTTKTWKDSVKRVGWESKTPQARITKVRLDTLRQLLRRTARKNTAIVCHCIRGLDQGDFLDGSRRQPSQ